MNGHLRTNPILHFRKSNEYKPMSLDGTFSLIHGVHLNNDNRSVLQTDILVSSTLITETREAVDSSEHS